MPTFISRYAKGAAAVTTAALVALSPLLPVSSAARQWVDVALTVLGALAVVQVRNAPAALAAKASAVKPRARKRRASKTPTDPPSAAPLP